VFSDSAITIGTLDSLHNTEIRNRVFSMTSADWEAALQLAKTIPDLWYRCQALSYVARKCPIEKEKIRIAQKALKVAYEMKVPKRVVTIASWPLMVVAEVAESQILVTEVGKLLEVASTESHPVGRLDALMALMTVSLQNDEAFFKVWPSFKATCLEAHSWRTGMQLARLAPHVKKRFPQLLPEFLDLIWSQKLRTKVERRLVDI
jgi:hypothetical protein